MEFRMTFAVGVLALTLLALYLASLIWGLANCLERVGIWLFSAAKCLRGWQREREARQAKQLQEMLAEVR